MTGRNPIDVHVGGRLRLARKIRGLPQREVAGSLGVSFQQVQKYENGMSRIGAGRLFQLAQYLDVSLGFFYDEMPAELLRLGSGASGPDRSIATPLDGLSLGAHSENRELLRLVSAFLKIPDPGFRANLVAFVSGLEESFVDRIPGRPKQ